MVCTSIEVGLRTSFKQLKYTLYFNQSTPSVEQI